ncbi:TolC family protein [Pasteurella sp. PK-2025]|uniref:TolC family protein n=1 Tax=unclassified Pasteurella TaxID=2621516 RepID=UPI003C76C97D
MLTLNLRTMLCAVCTLGMVSPAFAHSEHEQIGLKNVLRYALNADPKMLEAQANIDVANAQTNISKAKHYPVLSVANTQILTQDYKHEQDRRRSTPSVKAQVNVFSWGGIEAAVERDKQKAQYFLYKKEETRDQMGKAIGQLYLNALRAKESIAIYKESVARHRKILKDVKVIASYDEGRAYEIKEAEALLFQAESSLAHQQRILQVSLSQLNRYTPKPLTEKGLQDPFKQEKADAFLKRYRNNDLTQIPTYLAQLKELESAKANVSAAKANRYPTVNLEGNANRRGYDVALNVSWNILDLSSQYGVDHSRATELVASAKLQEILLEIQEQSRTAEIDLRQSEKRIAVARKQIAAQRKVSHDRELQFNVAQHSLIDVLNAYQDLSDAQIAEVNARNDYREAALLYLVSQSALQNWADIATFKVK